MLKFHSCFGVRMDMLKPSTQNYKQVKRGNQVLRCLTCTRCKECFLKSVTFRIMVKMLLYQKE
ncbi:putative structure protein 1l [SARS coronavirus ZJ0301]|uniref:Putative structure protein 1l n=2 Tax=Severe acute respiratory syndrome coronavirus TaxID=694009 RepID=Q3S2D3_SARS|nr:putative structure protein 1l [SARS coronavirus ZJ01]ABA02259.1 putative structure protein 1l [SARS coronavirus ZJ0301]